MKFTTQAEATKEAKFQQTKLPPKWEVEVFSVETGGWDYKLVGKSGEMVILNDYSSGEPKFFASIKMNNDYWESAEMYDDPYDAAIQHILYVTESLKRWTNEVEDCAKNLVSR